MTHRTGPHTAMGVPWPIGIRNFTALGLVEATAELGVLVPRITLVEGHTCLRGTSVSTFVPPADVGSRWHRCPEPGSPLAASLSRDPPVCAKQQSKIPCHRELLNAQQ